MADFDQKVEIDVKVKKENFDELLQAATELEGAAVALEGVEESVDGVEESFESLDKSVRNVEDSFDSIGDVSTDNIERNISKTRELTNTVNELNQANEELIDSSRQLDQAKKSVEKSNKSLADANNDTSESAGVEADSLQNLLQEAESLEDAKRATRDANEALTDANKRTADSAFVESEAFRNLQESAHDTDRVMAALFGDTNDVNESIDRQSGLAGNLSDQFDFLEDDNRALSRATRSLREGLDETTDSMRAANKVSGVFEDGLGNLSINLGAFTLALRNFLTQVPLLLAALGSLGSAAIGVAGAFVSAGSAIGSAIGAGALAMAQDLKSEYSEIEDLSQGLQVIMRELKSVFLEAFEPLTERDEVQGIFRQIIEGSAETVQQFASAFAEIMPEIDALVDDLGNRLSDPISDLIRSVTFMFRNLKDEFADLSVGFIEALASMARFTTRFTDGITEANGVLDQLTDTLAEMSELGATIFSGIEPVLIAFSSALESIAATLNSMNSAFVANAITLGVIIGAISRFGGVIASVINLVPNLVGALVSSNGSLKALSLSFTSFIKQNQALFGGLTSLADALENFSEQMTITLARTRLTSESFNELGEESGKLLRHTLRNTDSMEEFTGELARAAATADLLEDESDELSDELEDVEDELQRIGISARFAEEGLEELDDEDVDPDIARDTALVGGGAGLTGFIDDFKKSIGSKGLAGAIAGLLPSLGTLASTVSIAIPPLALLVALLGGALVGIIGNLDDIMAGLSTTVSALGSAFSFIVDQSLDVFIAVWNAMHDVMVGVFLVIKPLIDLFKALGADADSAGSAFDTLVDILEFVVDLIMVMIDTFGAVIRVIGTSIGIILEVFVAGILTLISTIQIVINTVSDWMTSFGLLDTAAEKTGSIIRSLTDTVKGFINWVQKIPEVVPTVMDALVRSFQKGFNGVISAVNDTIDAISAITGLNFQNIDRVEFGVAGREGARVSRAELGEQTDEMFGGTAGKKKNNITFNEDNSTNIDQTVNADPEDQAQLSRVVTDAIEEANSFERRRQGGQ